MPKSIHKTRARTAVLAIGIMAILIWLFWNGKTTEWSDEVPHRFRGSWKLIEDYYTDNYGIRSIHLSANVIILDMVFSEDEKESRTFPVRKVLWTYKDENEDAIIFYGPVDDNNITEFRLQIYIGQKRKISVREIVPTGWGEDGSFDVGEFYKSS